MNFIEESNRIYCKDSQGKVIAEVTFPDIRYHVVNLDLSLIHILKECIIYGAHIQEGTPTPEAPISPTFVGGSGNITISITGIEPKMIPIPYPLIDADDYLNLTTGQGETTWKGIELIGTESWQKSGKTAVGGTVFYVTLSDQDTQGTTKRVFSTHFQQAQNAGALVPGDIWMHNATFIAMPNTLLGIIDLSLIHI